MEKVRKTPILHMFCGEVNGSKPELQNVTLFYFMRTTHDGIPSFDSYAECNEQMTHYLIVGSLNGKFLISMHRMITQVLLSLWKILSLEIKYKNYSEEKKKRIFLLLQVFRPLIHSQFRGPELVDIYEEKEEIEEASFTDIVAARVRIYNNNDNNPFFPIVFSKKKKKRNEDKWNRSLILSLSRNAHRAHSSGSRRNIEGCR